DTVAAFIAEPVQGAGGVIVPPPNYWPLVRQICDKYGVLLIADEVVTGFGRSGELFGTRLWGVNADMWCLAKGISSGYIPLGATAINRRIADVFDADTTGTASVSHGYTYSAHPIAAAAALATLDQIEALDIPGNAARVGAHLQTRLRKLMAKRTPMTRSSDIPARVAKAAYKAGLMVRISGPNLILSPPLVITREEVDFMCDVLEAAFAAVQEGRA
ncbi:MAG: aspartate aminotransferase family protein, partial [Comamonadaceae bacterium PBBC2]